MENPEVEAVGPADLEPLFRTWSESENTDVFLYAGEINEKGSASLSRLLRSNRSKPNITLILGTLGGYPDAAYRMAKAIKRSHPSPGEFTVVVPGLCKSSGTLLTLAADHMVMSDEGELGPLDIQLYKRDEIYEWTSGLNTGEALSQLRTKAYESFLINFIDLRTGSKGQITTKTAADISTKLTVGLFAPVYAQIDPIMVAENERAMAIMTEYGCRLASKNVRRSEDTEDALSVLISGYPSHAFVIDREEAERRIFRKVRQPHPHESAVLDVVGSALTKYTDEMEPLVLYLDYKPLASEDVSDDSASKSRTPADGASGAPGGPVPSDGAKKATTALRRSPPLRE